MDVLHKLVERCMSCIMIHELFEFCLVIVFIYFFLYPGFKLSLSGPVLIFNVLPQLLSCRPGEQTQNATKKEKEQHSFYPAAEIRGGNR